MIARITLYLIAVIPLIGFAQVPFEKGYYYDNDGKRIECLIKNIDWNSNPKKFEYKLSKDNEPGILDISTVEEFGIDHFSRYVRRLVKIDRSSNQESNLSNERKPLWKEEPLLLKVLVEGPATLYYYREGSFIRFFYSMNDTTVQQLVFKKYLSAANTVEINSDFRQQLWMDVNCNQSSQEFIKEMPYTMPEMVQYFSTYNTCRKGKVIVYTERRNRVFPSFWITPGIDYASFGFTQNIPSLDLFNVRQIQFNHRASFRLGFHLEFLMRAFDNRLAIVLEPTFQSFTASGASNIPGETIKVNYKSIEVPMGIKGYLFSVKETKVFINALVVVDQSLPGSQVEWRAGSVLKTVNNLSFAGGAGFTHKKLSMEFRYYSKRVIIGPSDETVYYWVSDFHKISLVLGYRLFSAGPASQ